MIDGPARTGSRRRGRATLWAAAQTPPGTWRDVEGDYAVNEIAINWNAALVHALAAFANPGVAMAGDGSYADGLFTASGSGTGIGGNADECFYVCQLITSDCDIRARLASVQNPPSSGRGGVMIRETLDVGSTCASVSAGTSDAPWFTQGTTHGGGTATNSSGSGSWVRVTRSGSTLTAYRSSNGTSWTSMGTATSTMSNVFYVGLSVSSYADGTSSTVGFDSVSLFITNGNTAPVLNPLSNQVVNAGQAVTFDATGTDTSLPTQTLTYSLLSAPTNATLDAASGHFNWRPLVTQAGSAHLITVKVADNGFPSMSATQSCLVTVNPLVTPTLDAPSWTNGQLTFSFDDVSGPDYAVQPSTNLVEWETVFITNSPSLPFTWTDTNDAAVPMRFYRVKIGPPLP